MVSGFVKISLERVVVSPISKKVGWRGVSFFISDQEREDLTNDVEKLICVPCG